MRGFEACKIPLLYALLATGLWVVSCVAGHQAVARGIFKLEVPDREAQLAEMRKRLVHNPHRNFRQILLNNLLATVILMVVGAGSMGLFVIFNIGWFGLATGMAVAQLEQAGIQGALIWSLLAPHGLLEIPALCMSAGVGLRGAWLFVRYLRGQGMLREGELSQLLWTAGLSLGMIVAAALVEAYITPQLAITYLQ